MQRLIGALSAVLLVVIIIIAAAAFAQEKPAPFGQGPKFSDAAATTASAGAQEKPAGGSTQRQAILALLAQLETSFNAGDAKSLAACWTETGEFVGPAGARADGREGIEKQFQAAFAAGKPSSKLQLHVNQLRLVNDGLALVEAIADVKPAVPAGGAQVAAFVLVKPNGSWLIESARETNAPLPPASHLKELDWLVGDWSSETSKAGITLRTACDWTANHAFLIRKFKVDGKEAFLSGGTEIIGWDPRTSRIRSWLFDSDGGFGENVWVRDGNRWLIQYSGTLADGSAASAIHILTNVDATTITLQSRDRVVNGAAQADIPQTELKRQTGTNSAAKAEDAAQPVRKAAP